MGIHFDTLIDLLKTNIALDEGHKLCPDIHPYLSDLVKSAALFEFRLASNQVFPKSGKDKEEYNRYIEDYFQISEKYDQFLITPFKTTVIEDLESVVILDKQGDNKYKVVECMTNNIPDLGEVKSLSIGEVTLYKPNPEYVFPMNVAVLYSISVRNGIKDFNLVNLNTRNILIRQMTNSITSYIEELIYIMDPENFIISQESNASKKENQRSNKGKKNRKPRKTAIRPHYICLGENETKDFFKDQNSEPRLIHPVRGHWRRLQSDKYRFKQGQKVPVRQHYRGHGQIDGKNGMHYQVFIKESPVQLVPYKN